MVRLIWLTNEASKIIDIGTKIKYFKVYINHVYNCHYAQIIIGWTLVNYVFQIFMVPPSQTQTAVCRV